MTIVRAFFDEDEPVMLRTPADVAALLARAQADSREFNLPLFMQWYIEGSDAVEFGVGVNDDRGTLNFTGGNWPGLWFSQGDPDASEELLSYDYMSHERPVPASCEISFTRVVQAAQEFLSTGERPTSIAWKELHSE
ncbi:Imm1 family immunity protein [Actinokineospora auranticolor]|uniref:Immunity protein Imm1 of predicted polymorphic toxin system n=1 Tax=Actinokineospora auranticolor TaxID=155976 RepID=A0A2S6GLX8_9PSEU|nr:Imm1 family immunity protein [Actinokineospora auranticolor]PPK66242.1 immunity protein Imm1 of predicted polymorphic toxin system [Actinokineospora auranticolor]